MSNAMTESQKSPTLPCGVPVAPITGSMRDTNHTHTAVAERVTWHNKRFRVGTIVRRDDGCTIRITALNPPTVGGYVHASGDHLDRQTLVRTGGLNYATGRLACCTIVS